MRSIEGDLIAEALAGRFDVIVHGCNCFHTMGAGIAKAIRTTFPEAYAADLATVKGDRTKLGTYSVAVAERNGRTVRIVNAYTQYQWAGGGPKVDYEAVRQVMRAVKRDFSGLRFGYPKIGAGLAGGDWGRLQSIIEEELAGEDHLLVELPPVEPAAVKAEGVIYTGIGSRKSPPEVLEYMKRLAARLAARGFVLRSGAADGADSAFEAGCVEAGGVSEIWLPWKGFNDHSDTGLYPSHQHFELARTLHPAWERLSRGPRALHARNVGQVLGKDLESPAAMVVCWTPDGCDREEQRTASTGGTATAIVLAHRRGIPVFNLAKPGARERLQEHVLSLISAPEVAGEHAGAPRPS